MPDETDRPEGEGFFNRWSRRKRGGAENQPAADPLVNSDEVTPTDTTGEAEIAQPEEQAAAAFDDVDFETLDYSSDYTRFMGDNVPDHIRKQALAKLWASDPVLANLDGLTDYSDDFTDAALAVPLGMLKTAHRVGKGFLTDEEVAEWEQLGRPADDPASAVAGAGAAAVGSSVSITIESPDHVDIRALFDASDAYSNSLYPAESNNPVSPEKLIGAGAVFAVARDEEQKALGCGAVICQPDGRAELKRMWVDPSARRGGIGAKILNRLIDEARQRQVSWLGLETGYKQREAIALYRNSGFKEIDPFPPYADDPNSVFMALALERPSDDDTTDQPSGL